MHRQLPADCLNEIFEYKVNLRSCLLVNRLWCKTSVRFLWTSIQNYNTLITCLPNESKEILYKDEIIISTPNSKPPLFNYVSFIKSLSMGEINYKIKSILKGFDNNKNRVVIQEIIKMFMSQTSLRKLEFWFTTIIPDIPFTTYPGAINCLRNLSELTCPSNPYPEFFYQLSRMCHNIQSLNIDLTRDNSSGLLDLISVQQNLKYLNITSIDCKNSAEIFISSLTKHSDTLTKLYIELGLIDIPLSFIAKFTNLQQLELFGYSTESFKSFQHVTFSQLQILKFPFSCPNHEDLTKFLENNGKSLMEIYLDRVNIFNSLNLAIAKFCPNLKSLCTIFLNYEVETLKIILNSCQQLESIGTWCSNYHFNENELLEIVVKHSPKKFYELKIYYTDILRSELFLDGLEPVFKSWANRIPQKSLSLIIIDEVVSRNLKVKKESKEVIEKFKKLGVIKEFNMSCRWCSDSNGHVHELNYY